VTVLEIVRFCETCTHWRYNPDHPSVPNDTAICARMDWNGDYPDDETTLANAFAYDGGDAVVFTHRHFGCLMHEAKDTAGEGAAEREAFDVNLTGIGGEQQGENDGRTE
jgi:hypothetical protein